MTKKNILLISIFGVVAFLISMYSVDFGICERGDYDCRKTLDLVQMSLGVFVPFIFLTLITYRMKEEVVRSWWGIASVFVPLIMITTFLLYRNGESGGVGMGGIGGGIFEVAILFILYAIFIIASLVRIGIVWREMKTGQRMSPVRKALLVVFTPILIVAVLWFIASLM